MASLAKELQGERFHLIASHNQVGGGEAALHEIFQNDLDVFADNVSVTKFSEHPGVEGTGYVPYYMVFDEHGQLAHHHQGGPYHGGDGTAVLDRVRRMVRDLPALTLDPEPKDQRHPIAKQLSSDRTLAKGVRALASALQADPENTQLLGLERALKLHISSSVQAAKLLLADDYERGLGRLHRLQEQLEGSPWSKPLEKIETDWLGARGRILESNAALKRVRQSWSKLKPVSGNAGPVRNPRDRGFQSRNQTDLEGLRRDLAALMETFSGLPAADKADALWRLIGG